MESGRKVGAGSGERREWEDVEPNERRTQEGEGTEGALLDQKLEHVEVSVNSSSNTYWASKIERILRTGQLADIRF